MNKSAHKLENSFQKKWINPLLRAFSSRDTARQAMVHPCVIDGRRTLIHERGLKEGDALAYQRVVSFAEANGYRLLEDRRSDFIEGVKRVKDKSKANVITLMVLTTTLMSRNVLANPNLDTTHDDPVSVPNGQHETAHGVDLDLPAYDNEEELMAGLLAWINHHSTFSHSIGDMPKIVTVSAVDMAKVAFGDELPKAVNPETLNIFGLYNFNERAVYILDTLDMSSDKGKSILLHELVHFLQYEYGQDKDAACKNELEALAYLLEAKYLHSHNHNPGFTLNQVERISQCT